MLPLLGSPLLESSLAAASEVPASGRQEFGFGRMPCPSSFLVFSVGATCCGMAVGPTSGLVCCGVWMCALDAAGGAVADLVAATPGLIGAPTKGAGVPGAAVDIDAQGADTGVGVPGAATGTDVSVVSVLLVAWLAPGVGASAPGVSLW